MAAHGIAHRVVQLLVQRRIVLAAAAQPALCRRFGPAADHFDQAECAQLFQRILRCAQSFEQAAQFAFIALAVNHQQDRTQRRRQAPGTIFDLLAASGRLGMQQCHSSPFPRCDTHARPCGHAPLFAIPGWHARSPARTACCRSMTAGA